MVPVPAQEKVWKTQLLVFGRYERRVFLPCLASAGQMCCTDAEPVDKLCSMVHHPPGWPICPVQRDLNSPASPAFSSNGTAMNASSQGVLRRQHTVFVSDAAHLDKNRNKLHSRASALRRSDLRITCS